LQELNTLAIRKPTRSYVQCSFGCLISD
jgi:hypothetical protein